MKQSKVDTSKKIMTSNAYIGQGIHDNSHLMKIGKSNDVTRRQRELGITIERIEQCIDEVTALKFENDLRQLAIQQGGIRYKRTLDWFEFDASIYSLLLEFFNVPDETDQKELSEDEEIYIYRERYYQLLRDIVKRLEQAVKEKNEEIKQLRKTIDEIRQKKQIIEHIRQEEHAVVNGQQATLQSIIIELHRKIGRLEAQIEFEQQKHDKKSK
jgi:predicted esterase YcpF (UPF0227 family)